MELSKKPTFQAESVRGSINHLKITGGRWFLTSNRPQARSV